MPRGSSSWSLSIVASLLALGGCASEPYDPAPVARYDPFAKPPAHAARKPSTRPAPAVTPTASPLTLREAILEALAKSPDLQAAEESIAQARGDYTSAAAIPNPQLYADTVNNTYGKHFDVNDTGGPPQWDVAITQQVDTLLFGKRSAAMESAARETDAAAATFQDLVRQRVRDAASGYLDLLEAREAAALARDNTAGLARAATLTAERVRLGGGAAIDLDRARLAVALAREDERAAESALVVARGALRALIGRKSGDAAIEPSTPLDVPAPAMTATLPTLIDRASDLRPDLQALQRQVSKADADIVTADRGAFPVVNYQLGFTYQRQGDALGAPDAKTWYMSLTTTLPVFDRNDGNRSKAQSARRQAAHALDAALVQLQAEVEQALDAFLAARAAVQADDAAQLEAARSVRDRTEAGYAAGGRTLLDLLDAERAWRDSRRQHIRAQSAYWHAFYRLGAAVAGPIGED